ncbi:MAG: fasciclin domain-containing protein [Alphaproteobacteria bacterium]|nr:fasciclin domain-containing protein [Alphaproteobacteria bacterium]
MRYFLLLSVSALTLFAAAMPASAETATKTKETVTAVKEKTAEVVEAAKDKTVKAVETVKEETPKAIEAAKDKTAEVVEATKEKTAEVVEATKEKTAEVVEAVKEETPKAVEAAKEKAADAVEAVKEEVTEATTDAPPAAPVQKTLKEVISDEDDLEDFVDLMKKAGFEKTVLDNPAPFTLFVPTNEALDKAEKKLDEAQKSSNKDALADIINYHIVNGLVTRSALDNNTSEVLSTTLKRLRVVGKDGKLTVNGMKVEDKELTAGNAVIYKLDGVLGLEDPAAPAPVVEAPKAANPAADAAAAAPATASEAPAQATETPKTEEKKSKFKFW